MVEARLRWIVVLCLTAVVPFTSAQEAAPPSPAGAPRLFAVVFRTGPAWDASQPPGRQRHFQEHSANIARLRAEGRAVLGGRFADMGLLLVRADSEAEARSLLAADASLAAGTFTADVHPWTTFAAGCLEGRK